MGEHEVHEGLDLEPEADRFCLFSIKFSPDSDEILCGSSDRCVYIYDLDRRQVSLKLSAHKDDINTVCYASSDSRDVFVSGSDDCQARLWDRRALRHGKPVGVLLGHVEGITHVAPKGDGRYVATNSKDQTLKLWDLRCLRDANTEDSDAQPRGGYDYRFGRQNLPSRSPHPLDTSLLTFRGHQVFQTLIRCNFSPPSTGQRYLFSGSYDGSLYIYDLISGQMASRLKGHRATLREASWHPHQPLIVTSSWDSTARRWDYAPPSDPTTATDPMEC